jgi:coenzyme F420-reducing hydrogenase delta subunit
MRALESGADKVYLVTCPEGACRYREGNMRAKKRLAYTQGLIEEIGLEKDRLELIPLPAGTITTVAQLAQKFLARQASFGPLPVNDKGKERHKRQT